ncbi:hypothetical protein KUTeg_006184 [Tegillarca granosa]|uniref:Uncharacterized protein n=1 Tax=Tegillarca granosa TaxID=220873 RepID=A0ABQ9FKH0_TEGGR|nr:hypothetical protein KUTeg_006184 [Tegillarca granosa]
MGDYHYYGCEGHQDIHQAARLYAQAAIKNDPHVSCPINVYKSICKDSPRTEAYIPCSISLYRIQGLEIWSIYEKPLKVIGFIVVAVITTISMYIIFTHMRNPHIVQQETI